MALDAKHRSSIYEKLVPILGDEDANVLMSEFPSVEADELVTKQFLRAELAELRTDMHDGLGSLRTEMHDEVGSLRAEMSEGFGRARAELSEGLGRVRAELSEGLGGLRAETGDQLVGLRTEMYERFHQQTVWLFGAIAAATALIVAAIPLLG